MALVLRFFGRPSLVVDGTPRPLTGRKPWALLAYVLLAPRPPTRSQIAELLFAEADDPLAALRWTLAQVRRALADAGAVLDRDGRLVAELGPGAIVDAMLAVSAQVDPATAELLEPAELLEGMHFDDSPAFEQWLTLERQRTSSALRELLRWNASLLARSEPDRALRLIDRAVALDPFNDALHELAMDICVTRGDRDAARAYLDAVTRRYRAELGIDPPAMLRRPLERPAPGGSPIELPHSVTTGALLDLASARMDGGDYPGAEDAARRASASAAASGEIGLEARALATLGAILVHSVRGRDREAIGILTRASQLASHVGDAGLASDAERELGYIAFLAADYGSAEVSLARAAALADAARDDGRRGQALTFLAACRIDRSDLPGAERAIGDALAALDAAQDRRFRSFALSFLARARIRAGDAPDGEQLAREALTEARAVGWHSVVPWILAHVGEAQLAQGRVDEAAESFSRAFALGAEIADPCWEAIALRGLAHIESLRGDAERARAMLDEAHQRCTRVPDTMWWADAAILTDLVELEAGRDAARVDAALRLVRRGPMPDLAARLMRYARSQTPFQTVP